MDGQILNLKAHAYPEWKLSKLMFEQNPTFAVLLVDACSSFGEYDPDDHRSYWWHRHLGINSQESNTDTEGKNRLLYVTAPTQDLSESFYLDLFFKTRGFLTLRAATEGQTAIGGSKGGYFLRSCLSVLHPESVGNRDKNGDGHLDWEEFFVEVKRVTNQLGIGYRSEGQSPSFVSRPRPREFYTADIMRVGWALDSRGDINLDSFLIVGRPHHGDSLSLCAYLYDKNGNPLKFSNGSYRAVCQSLRTDSVVNSENLVKIPNSHFADTAGRFGVALLLFDKQGRRLARSDIKWLVR